MYCSLDKSEKTSLTYCRPVGTVFNTESSTTSGGSRPAATADLELHKATTGLKAGLHAGMGELEVFKCEPGSESGLMSCPGVTVVILGL